MKNTPKSKRGFTLVELLVVIVIIASLAGLAFPSILRAKKQASKNEATSNARQIGISMIEFESEYGSFPDAATQLQVSANFPGSAIVGSAGTSNAIFRQLFEAGYTQSEDIFFAKTPTTKKPDGDITATATTLEAGECGFGYLLNGVDGYSTSGNPARFIAATPMDTAVTFNAEPFDRKAVLLRIDSSVVSANIAATAGATKGPAMLSGANVLANTNPIWTGTTPVVQLPIPK
jgi:prepilin-type N-terminal cleavage/methylation domain-containing protein